MEAPSDSTAPEFWSVRYAAGRTPWDLHAVPESLHAYLHRSSTRGRVLIPGCGSGYEVRAFHDAGYDVSAIDFSPIAIEQAQRVLGPLESKVQLGDFFGHDLGERRFDLIYERTFLCSMPPERWREYATRMAQLLVPGGQLVGIFLYGMPADPPPFPMTDAQAAELFGRGFELCRSESLPASLSVFKGMGERWQEWRRI